MTFDRRKMLAGMVGFSGAAILPAVAKQHATDDFTHPFANASGAHEEIALLIYPQMTTLDLVGPHHFLSFMGGARIHLVTNQPDLSTVVTDTGIGIQPTMTIADCPQDLDLLFVPGGTGAVSAARDANTIAFLRNRGARARLISSVCTGSLLLGAAGLLRERRATSHWLVVDCLAQFGAKPVHQRVVKDSNVITAAGVSAGLDLGIFLVEQMRGRALAEAAVLVTEYDPNPPLHSGSVATARSEITHAVSNELRGFLEQAKSLSIKA